MHSHTAYMPLNSILQDLSITLYHNHLMILQLVFVIHPIFWAFHFWVTHVVLGCYTRTRDSSVSNPLQRLIRVKILGEGRNKGARG